MFPADRAVLVIPRHRVEAAPSGSQPPVAARRGLAAFELRDALGRLRGERDGHRPASRLENLLELLLHLGVIQHASIIAARRTLARAALADPWGLQPPCS